ncbi:MAG: ABC transporter permease [Thermomicrobiales bacterium]
MSTVRDELRITGRPTTFARRVLLVVRTSWKRYPTGVIAGVALLLVLLIALQAGWFSPGDPVDMAPADRLQSPADAGYFGTDVFGRDVLSRIIFGLRISLGVGVASVLFATIAGTLLGLVAGYVGRWPEYLTMRLMDVLFAFPSILLAILIVSIRGAGFVSIILATALVYTPIFARIVRGSTLSVKNREYVQAAVASGATTPRILFRHVLPNVSTPILVQLALSMSGAVILEAALSFLGLGAVPPTPSLGSMLSENRTYMEQAPWTVIFPGLALGLLVLCINMVGDAIRDAFDPRLRTTAP